GTYTIDLNSWFDDDSCPNGVASGTGATLGTNSGNPELGSLKDNGGYTETMMPSWKSGLINAGNPQTCTVRDQRSAQRVGTCDIGAVEHGGSVPRTLTVTNDGTLDPGSLRAILTEANDGDTIIFDPSLKNHTIFMLSSGSTRHITLDKSVVINGDVDGDHKPDIILSGTGEHNTRLLYVNPGKTVTLEGLRLESGFADYGGAIWNYGTLTINYCRLSHNTARDGYKGGSGGAIYNDASGTLIINNTTLNHNTSMTSGGAIQNFMGKVMLMNVTLSDNAGDPDRANEGAALDNWGGGMTLKNTTLYRTTGNGIGTFWGKEISSGTTLINTVIAGSSENNCVGHGAYHMAGNNWFDDNTCGSSNSGDPKLGGPLSTDSGWALNMPASNSGLIDAGDDNTCLPLDARGYRRPHGDHCDIGAVELGATAPPATEEGADAAAASHGERRRVVP
ncbi:choice-of-anchor Q domain-containing protein, partial [Thiolapillus sp.]|uniref:choice-of-anchor Q domain-containing protein n=1 Tax=Thiolapillus sp. TaxID=2017437 RepID=UPI003AF75B39